MLFYDHFAHIWSVLALLHPLWFYEFADIQEFLIARLFIARN